MKRHPIPTMAIGDLVVPCASGAPTGLSLSLAECPGAFIQALPQVVVPASDVELISLGRPGVLSHPDLRRVSIQKAKLCPRCSSVARWALQPLAIKCIAQATA